MNGRDAHRQMDGLADRSQMSRHGEGPVDHHQKERVADHQPMNGRDGHHSKWMVLPTVLK